MPDPLSMLRCGGLAAMLCLVGPLATVAEAAPSGPPVSGVGCVFVLGFRALHGMVPGIIGACLDDEQHNPANGDALQHTTGGLLVWRKADNHTAFTNGYATWVNGPKGLEYRLNTQRFAWEANQEHLPVVPDAAVEATLSMSAGPQLRVTNSTLGHVDQPLRIQVTGRGFVPGETVTLVGALTPALVTRTLTGPIPNPILTPIALGPVQATADASGDFSASIGGARNPAQGGDFTITATGNGGAPTTSVGSGALP